MSPESCAGASHMNVLSRIAPGLVPFQRHDEDAGVLWSVLIS